MKKPAPHRRLPIDFGNEAESSVPVCRPGPARPASPASVSGRDFGGLKIIGRRGLRQPRPTVRRKFPPFGSSLVNRHSPLRRCGFTLVEILVVLALLSLIVFALMTVFSATQRAFRASLTQTDTLESGRAVMDLIAGDLETMTPTYGYSNAVLNSDGSLSPNCPVNFSCVVNDLTFPPSPLYQTLIGSVSGAQRTNLVENIFIIGKNNINGVPSWVATGYSVTNTLPDGTLYPLYRFYMTTNITAGPYALIAMHNAFSLFQYTNSAIWSHLMDGVVDLTARVYDTNGVWLTNGYINPSYVNVQNISVYNSGYGEDNCLFYSNAVPASVQIQLGTLEDRTMEHAEALSGVAQSNYLSGAAAEVHLFNRRVWIRNLDISAYQ